MSTRALTTKIEDVKKYLRLENASIANDSFIPDMARAEMEYIIPIIGQTEYDVLLTNYEASIATSPTALDADDTALLSAIRWASVPLCFYLLAPELFSSITSGGIMHKHNPDQGQIASSKWAFKELRLDLLTKGMSAIDRLYDFLDKATPGTYAAWESSVNYTQFKDRFIQTTEQFSNCYNINNNRRTFLKLKAIMADVEEEWILPTISAELFAALKTKLVARTALTSYETMLVAKIRKAIAYYSIYYGLDQIVFVQNGNSIVAQMNITTDEYGSEVGGTTISDNTIERMKLDALTKASGFIKNVEKYLDDNASHFSAYTSSELYTAKQNNPRIEVNHKDSKTFFFH